MAEPKGKYVKHGDVEEWEWDKDGPSSPKLTGGWVVPDGEFDPTSAPAPEASPAERAQEMQSKGLTLAVDEPEEEPKAVPKAAEPKAAAKK